MKHLSRTLALGAFGLALLLSAHGPAKAMAIGGNCAPSIRGDSSSGCTHYACYLTDGDGRGNCSYGNCSTWSTC